MLQVADLAITDLTITAEREGAVDFTMPFMNLGMTLADRAKFYEILVHVLINTTCSLYGRDISTNERFRQTIYDQTMYDLDENRFVRHDVLV